MDSLHFSTIPTLKPNSCYLPLTSSWYVVYEFYTEFKKESQESFWNALIFLIETLNSIYFFQYPNRFLYCKSFLSTKNIKQKFYFLVVSRLVELYMNTFYLNFYELFILNSFYIVLTTVFSMMVVTCPKKTFIRRR